MPSFGFSLSLILLPLVLVGLKTIAARFVPVGSTAYEWFEFIGHPFTAILVACLVAIYGGNASGHAERPRDGDLWCRAATGGDYPAGDRGGRRVQAGAGGFRRWPGAGRSADRNGPADCGHLLCTGRGGAYHSGLRDRGVLNRRGSGNAGIEQLNYSGAQMAALSICIAGGSIVVSHVNDAGFWLFGKFTGATEAQTLKTGR